MRIYFVESKSFSHDGTGSQYQIKDMGDLPTITTNKKYAYETAKSWVGTYLKDFGYQLLNEWDDQGAAPTTLLHRWSLYNIEQDMIEYISIYKGWTV